MGEFAGSGLYTEDVPMEGGVSGNAIVEPDACVSDGDAVGCALPAGGVDSLRCLDLTLSSEEEAETTALPAPSASIPPAASQEAEADLPKAVPAVVSSTVPAG